jgi:hypothetical protein
MTSVANANRALEESKKEIKDKNCPSSQCFSQDKDLPDQD